MKNFTFIELAIVIAIIGILVSVVPVLHKEYQQSKSDIKTNQTISPCN